MASSPKKRKISESEHVKMDQIINLGIPHIGEKIFQSIDSETLIGFLSVSNAWKVLAGNVLFKRRYKDQIFYACIDAPLAFVEILVERSETEELNEKKEDLTPFMTACKNGRDKVVKVFLEYSERKVIDLNAKNSLGMTAFMLAIMKNHTKTVQALLEYQGSNQIDVNAKEDREGNTAFMIALSFW